MGFMDKIKDAAAQAADQAKQATQQKMAELNPFDPTTRPASEAVPAAAAADPNQVLLEVTSHTEGKNAKVRVYPDRIEWEMPKSVSGAKMIAAVLTVGMSAAVTGGVKSRAGAGTEVIYMDSVTSVTTKRDSMLNDVVSVVTAGNTIDFRVSKSEAEALKTAILGARARLRQAPAQQPVVVQAAPAAAPAESSVADKVKQLADLHAAGVLTDDEFAAAKAKALGI